MSNDLIVIPSEVNLTDAERVALAADIRRKMQKTTASIIEVGRDFRKVKKRMPRGGNHFRNWVAEEVGISIRSAENYMNVAEMADKNATVAFLPPSVVYKLAAPSTPSEVRGEVLARSAAGEVIRASDVTRAIKKVKDAKRQADFDAERMAATAKAKSRKPSPQRRQELEWRASQAAERAARERREMDAKVAALIAAIGDEHAEIAAKASLDGGWGFAEAVLAYLAAGTANDRPAVAA